MNTTGWKTELSTIYNQRLVFRQPLSYLLLFQNDLCCIPEFCPLLLLFISPLKMEIPGANFSYLDQLAITW